MRKKLPAEDREAPDHEGVEHHLHPDGDVAENFARGVFQGDRDHGQNSA